MTGESISLAPLFDIRLLAAFGFVGLAFVIIGLLKGARGIWFRLIVLVLLLLAVANPRIVQEQREAQNDIAIVIVDRTASQNVGARKERTEATLAMLRERLQKFENMDVREVDVLDGGTDEGKDGTHLISALQRAVGNVPKGRFAGALIITDGQVHDLTADNTLDGLGGPVHVMLSGEHDERDRRLVVDKAPSYGIVGKDITITYHIEDKSSGGVATASDELVKVVLRDGEREIARAQIPVGKTDKFTFPLEHAGPSILEISVEPVEGELSEINNRTLISINGVRDRLRVLLVSGQPHAGERTWRNLLKSDPSVDLVHFTILRPPEKDDFTPLNELALIAFPVRELFEVKLYDFDLVVFDRYLLRDILPPSYLENISDYVSEGGAFLLSVGPEFSDQQSLYGSALQKVLPAAPTGQVFEQAYRPQISDIGKRHPVTEGLASRAPINREDPTKPGWGRWFRQIDAQALSGSVVMTGPEDRALLVLDRVDKGRVALMLSDHIWLWARGYDGGGPQAELLRRLAHWLMKEPDLEEESLRAEVKGGKLQIQRRSLSEEAVTITVTTPSGKTEKLSLKQDGKTPGRVTAPADEIGLYVVTDGTLITRAASGALNPVEFADLRTTGEYLSGVAANSGGGLFWITDGNPDVRRVRPERDASGKGWAGLLDNKSYIVTGVTQIPLLPGIAIMLLLLGGLMASWWREGR